MVLHSDNGIDNLISCFREQHSSSPSSRPYTSFSVKLSGIVHELHRCLLQALIAETSGTTKAQILKVYFELVVVLNTFMELCLFLYLRATSFRCLPSIIATLCEKEKKSFLRRSIHISRSSDVIKQVMSCQLKESKH